jgi:transposase
MCPRKLRWTHKPEQTTELSTRLVVGHGRDGRCRYDKVVKQELIEACLQPGVSVARMALQHGINANLLCTWIVKYRNRSGAMVVTQNPVPTAAAIVSAFVPVVELKVPAKPNPVRIGAHLPNGVSLDLSELGLDEMSSSCTC